GVVGWVTGVGGGLNLSPGTRPQTVLAIFAHRPRQLPRACEQERSCRRRRRNGSDLARHQRRSRTISKFTAARISFGSPVSVTGRIVAGLSSSGSRREVRG